MDTKEIILDVKNLNTTFISDRKEIRIVKNVSWARMPGSRRTTSSTTPCGTAR